MSRPEKLQKLSLLHRSVPYVSQSALGAILAAVQEMGMPDLIGRNQIRQARDATMNHKTKYGPILQSMKCLLKDSDEHVEIPVAHPMQSWW